MEKDSYNDFQPLWAILHVVKVEFVVWRILTQRLEPFHFLLPLNTANFTYAQALHNKQLCWKIDTRRLKHHNNGVFETGFEFF
jgi:hypothetical protein